MPYTEVTENTLAVCSGRDGVETVLHAVRFPEGVDWTYRSPNTGLSADWPARAVFNRLRTADIGATLTRPMAEDVAERLVGEIWDFTGEEKRPCTFEEIAERIRPLIGAEVVDTY